MNDDTLEQIQTKIAFLERAIGELSDVAFAQHQEIQTLQRQLKAVSERLNNASPSEEASRTPEQERPPHY